MYSLLYHIWKAAGAAGWPPDGGGLCSRVVFADAQGEAAHLHPLKLPNRPAADGPNPLNPGRLQRPCFIPPQTGAAVPDR